MSPRQFKLIAWLLPLFIARSLLPIGFMLSFDASGARIVFCPSVISMPMETGGAHDHAAHAHHNHASHQAHHDGSSGSAEQSHQNCPFAFAAAAPIAAIAHFAVTPRAAEIITGPSDAAIITLDARAHPIRGPPALS